jgi:outer membrane receptor protein involved in Fe transport
MCKKLLVIVFALLVQTITYAQSNGSISGTVKDIQENPLPGVNVILENTTIGASSNFDGNYLINSIPVGNYKMIVKFIGYKTIVKDITIAENDSKVVDFILEEDLLSLNEVVVTGATNAKSKIEASVAITTMNAKAIEHAAPESTADLLQSIPGFVVETSGGEVGNNLFARGIPSAGAYEYVQIQEDGLPVFEDGALQFANVDNFYRVDQTIDRMEAVRGGTASILATGAPGGIINFISKTGQNDFKGLAKISVGDYGLFRTDLNFSGALVKDKLFFNLGGFYRVDDGIRDPGYKANKGGQIKANLLYRFDKGFVKVYHKKLNDRNIFYQSTPFVWKNGKVKEYKGFDANYGTFASKNFSKLKVPQGNGNYFEANLEDGVHPIVDVTGATFRYAINDRIIMKNAMKVTNIDMDYNAIFASHWMGNVSSQDQMANAFKINPADAKFTYEDNGAILDPSTELKRADYWFIHKDMQNFANNLSFNIDLDQINVTLGYYYSSWKSHQNWNWSSFMLSVSDNPRLVNLQNTKTGDAYTYHGVSGISWLKRESQIKGEIRALYMDTEITLSDQLTANVGLRYDSDRYSGYGDHGTWGNNLGVLKNNKADNGANILTGHYTHWKYNVNELSYSGALNYKFNDNMASYARFSHGFRSPIEEAFYGPAIESRKGTKGLDNLKVTKVNQYELGYKFTTQNFAVFANLFRMEMDNIAYMDIVNGTSENKWADVINHGIEVEAFGKIGDLNLAFNGTLQQPEYKGYKGAKSELNGNIARRIPKFYFSFRPDYNITEKLNVYFKYSYFGKKYQDIENKFELPSFATVNAGASYSIDNIRFAVDASNLFNVIGLTEADGYNGKPAPENGDTFMARSILGRSVRVSATINF